MKLPDEPFPSYLAKAKDIDAAWSACEQRFASLPPPLDKLAARFLDAIATASGSHRTYFSSALAPPLLYMPLWLFDGLDQEHATQAATSCVIEILAGTIQGYIGIRIQDDVLDERGLTDPNLLLFGNTCFSGMISAYAKALGPSNSAFWAAFDRSFVDFSRLTMAEQVAVFQDEPYSREIFDEHADKVAFARVPMLAVAALTGRQELEPLIRVLVHQLGIAYGIVNDVVGWTRDLRAGHRTWLLASAGLSRSDLEQALAIPEESARSAAFTALEEKLRPSLYEGHRIRDALRRSIDVQRQAAETARSLKLEGFDAYTHDRIEWLETFERQTSLLTLQRVLAAGSG